MIPEADAGAPPIPAVEPVVEGPWKWSELASGLPTAKKTIREGGIYTGEIKGQIDQMLEDMETQPGLEEKVFADPTFQKKATELFGPNYSPKVALDELSRQAKIRADQSDKDTKARTRESILSGGSPATFRQFARAKIGRMLDRDKTAKEGRSESAEMIKGATPDIHSKLPLSVGELGGQKLAEWLTPKEDSARKEERKLLQPAKKAEKAVDKNIRGARREVRREAVRKWAESDAPTIRKKKKKDDEDKGEDK